MTTSRLLILALIASLAPSTLAQDNALDQLRRENAQLKAENAQLLQQLRALQDKLVTNETDRRQLAADKQRLVAETQKIVAENNAYFITEDYDTGANTTTLSSRSWDMEITRGSDRYHWLSFDASYKGKSPSTTPSLGINFQTFFTGGVYGKLKDITLSADGQTLRLTVTDYENRYRRGGTVRNKTRKDDEFFTTPLTPDQLRTLAQAESVTGEMGYTRFNLTRDQLGSIKTLARQLKLIN